MTMATNMTMGTVEEEYLWVEIFFSDSEPVYETLFGTE
jgi:hypothetical protein